MMKHHEMRDLDFSSICINLSLIVLHLGIKVTKNSTNMAAFQSLIHLKIRLKNRWYSLRVVSNYPHCICTGTVRARTLP